MSLTQAESIELSELEAINEDCVDLEEQMPRKYYRRMLELKRKRNVAAPPVIVTPLSKGDS